jgi:hypothetical protein
MTHNQVKSSVKNSFRSYVFRCISGTIFRNHTQELNSVSIHPMDKNSVVTSQETQKNKKKKELFTSAIQTIY